MFDRKRDKNNQQLMLSARLSGAVNAAKNPTEFIYIQLPAYLKEVASFVCHHNAVLAQETNQEWFEVKHDRGSLAQLALEEHIVSYITKLVTSALEEELYLVEQGTHECLVAAEKLRNASKNDE